MAISEPDIHSVVIDGVPVFWAESHDPLRLAIMFRVGFGDEQLSWRGISHLVEHLALSGLAHQTYSYNGFVDDVRTIFHAQGSADQLVEYAQRVTNALANLPLDRITSERKVLESEQQSQPGGSWASHMSLRYGARGYGLVDYPQHGLRWVAGEQVSSWAAERFCKPNVAAWISGQPPNRLHFDLPADGKKVPQFLVESLALPTPCVTEHMANGVGVSMVGPRGPELVVAARIVDRRLKERLRWQQGVAYAPGCMYRPLSNDLAHLLLHSDASEEDADSVVETVLDVIRDLHLDGPTDAELTDEKATRRAKVPSAATEMQLDLRCLSELTGRAWKPYDVWQREQDEVTRASAAHGIREAWANAIVLAPLGHKSRAASLNEYPMWSTHRIHGRSHRRRLLVPGGVPSGAMLVSSDQGVMLVNPDGRYISVGFASTAAVLRGSNETRYLIGLDGFGIGVDPREWNRIDELQRLIDAHVPVDRFVPMQAAEGEAPPRDGCEVCGAVPAREVTLKRKTVRRREETLKARFCRDCGRATGRAWQDFTLRRTLLGMMTIPAVIANSIALTQLTLLSAPQRKSGVDHWMPGRPVFLSLGFYVVFIPIAVIVLVALVVWLGVTESTG